MSKNQQQNKSTQQDSTPPIIARTDLVAEKPAEGEQESNGTESQQNQGDSVEPTANDSSQDSSSDANDRAAQEQAAGGEVEVRTAERAQAIEVAVDDPYKLHRFSEQVQSRIRDILAGQDIAAITGIYALLDYSLRMAPGQGFSGPEEGARLQVGFYRAFVGVLNAEMLNFRLFFGTVLAIIDELKQAAFCDPLPFRFLPQMNLDLYNRENFSALLTLLMEVSSVEKRKNQRVLAHLDLNRGLRGLNQNGRDSVKAFLTA